MIPGSALGVLHCLPQGATGGAVAVVEDLVDELAQIGVRVHVASLSGASVRFCRVATGETFTAHLEWSAPGCVTAVLAMYARRNALDVVHGHLTASLPAALAARLTGMASVRTIHGRLDRPGMLALRQRLEFHLATRLLGQHVIAVSKAVADDITQHHRLRLGRQLFHIPNGCRLKDASEHGDREHVSFAFVGRFEAEKGLRELVGAFAQLRREQPSISLSLVGAGPLRAELDEHMLESGALTASSGWLDRHSVRSLVGQADVFVLPSWSEGLPVSLLEAMADGVVPIVSEAANGDGVVKHLANGLVFPTRSIAGLLGCMRWATANASALPEIGTAARATVAERFEVATTARRHVALYEALKSLGRD